MLAVVAPIAGLQTQGSREGTPSNPNPMPMPMQLIQLSPASAFDPFLKHLANRSHQPLDLNREPGLKFGISILSSLFKYLDPYPHLTRHVLGPIGSPITSPILFKDVRIPRRSGIVRLDNKEFYEGVY